VVRVVSIDLELWNVLTVALRTIDGLVSIHWLVLNNPVTRLVPSVSLVARDRGKLRWGVEKRSPHRNGPSDKPAIRSAVVPEPGLRIAGLPGWTWAACAPEWESGGRRG